VFLGKGGEDLTDKMGEIYNLLFGKNKSKVRSFGRGKGGQRDVWSFRDSGK
jgi:hypothetical protein